MTKISLLNKDKWSGFIFFSFLFFLIQIFDLIKWEFISFIAKNIFLIIFLSFYILEHRKFNPKNWLLNPAVLASLLTFLLSYCLTNYIYFIPGSQSEKQLYRLLGSEPLIILNYTMNLVIIAAFAMWVGYKTTLGIKLYKLMLSFPINFKKYFRDSFIPNLTYLNLFFLISVGARLLAISLGIYGFSSSAEQRSASIGIAHTVVSLGEIANICLLVISFAYFKNKNNYKYKLIFVIILVTEIIFGMISGMKSAVVMPLVLVFITYYMVNKIFHKGIIISVFIFIVIAYSIIEPFRILRMKDINFTSSPDYIVNTMVDAYYLNKRVKVVTDTEDIFTSTISRNAYLMNAAKAIQYEDERGLGENDPDFLEKIYTIPLQTFIPRLFWKSKPIEDIGNWFSINVWGSTRTGAVAITPIGFLYFAGGTIFVFLGFFMIGVLQKTLWQFYIAGGGQLLIFLSLLSTVVLIDTSINGNIVYWLRYFPVFILIQSFILKKNKI